MPCWRTGGATTTSSACTQNSDNATGLRGGAPRQRRRGAALRQGSAPPALATPPTLDQITAGLSLRLVRTGDHVSSKGARTSLGGWAQTDAGNPTPTFVLGPVQGTIGTRDQRRRLLIERRHAGRSSNADGQGSTAIAQCCRFHCGPDPLADDDRAVELGVRQNCRKLVTSIPCGLVPRTQSHSGDRLCNSSETVVANLVSGSVVDLLEVVYVDHQQT